MADYWQLEESADQWQLEESTDLWLLEEQAAAFAENADEGAWLGNMATGIARAVGATALALSAGLAHGIHQQTDECPRPDMAPGAESQVVTAIGRDPLPMVFVYDDDVVPQAVAPMFDDDGWVAERPPGQRVSLMGPEWDDSVPARVVDDVYEWTQQGVAPRPIPVAVAVDEEIVPEPVTQVIDEVYEVWPYVEPVETVVSLSEPGGGPGAPDVAPQLADDEGWISEKAVARAVQEAFSADDEIVPQPAVLGIDDETWQAPIVQWRVDARVFLDDDLVVTAPGEFVPDEQYELQLFVEPFETRVQLSEPAGGGPATPPAGEPLGVDELYWLQLRGYQRPATLFVPPANDEITQPAVPGEGAGGFPLIARYSPEIVQWEIADEIAQPAVPLPIAEEYDLKLRAYPVPPSLFTAPANDEITTPPVPQFEDDSWHLALWMPHARAGLHLPDPSDEWVAPPVPLPIDENEWPEAARHWVAAPVLGLYLPDPEEIPADSLVPLPIVETPNDGAVWPLPKYPQRVLPEEIRRQQRMVQEYLDELESRKKKVQSKRLSARERKAILTGKIEPRLTQAMAMAASDEQIKLLAENALAAKVDREAAQSEFKRRYWAAALSLMMFE